MVEYPGVGVRRHTTGRGSVPPIHVAGRTFTAADPGDQRIWLPIIFWTCSFPNIKVDNVAEINIFSDTVPDYCRKSSRAGHNLTILGILLILYNTVIAVRRLRIRMPTLLHIECLK